MRRGAGWSAALAAVLVAAGCDTPAEPPAEPTESFDQMIARDLDNARSNGASAAQIDLLEQAQQAGEVTFEMAREAAHNDIDCMIAAGLEAEYAEQTMAGVLNPGYTVKVGLDDDGTNDAKVEACDKLEYYWVSALFQTQPATEAKQQEHYAAYVPQLRACLEDAGQPPDQGATWDEMVHAAAVAKAEDSPGGACLDVVVEADLAP